MQHASTLQRKERIRWLNCLVVASLAAGASPAFRSWHQLEGSLAGRTTYAFPAAPGDDASTLPARQRLDRSLQRLFQHELRRQLGARGYSTTTADEPCLLVRFYARYQQEQGTVGERARAGEGPTTVRGAAWLAVHLIDPRSRIVLWRGWGGGVLGPCGEPGGQIAEAARRLMAALPAAQPTAET